MKDMSYDWVFCFQCLVEVSFVVACEEGHLSFKRSIFNTYSTHFLFGMKFKFTSDGELRVKLTCHSSHETLTTFNTRKV
jgi:hypothetical protein